MYRSWRHGYGYGSGRDEHLTAAPNQLYTSLVYRVCMSRTNIEIDDDLIARVMRRNGLPTKRAAVEWALRKVDLEPMSLEEALAMEGSGWGDGELTLEDVRPTYVASDS